MSSPDFNEECYVIDGEIEFDGVKFPADYYSYFPIGFHRKVASTQNGAVALIVLTKFVT